MNRSKYSTALLIHLVTLGDWVTIRRAISGSRHIFSPFKETVRTLTVVLS